MSEFDDFAQFMNLPEYPVKGTKVEDDGDIVSDLSSEDYDTYYRAAEFIIDEYWDIYKFYFTK